MNIYLLLILTIILLFIINYKEDFSNNTFFKPKIIISTNKEFEEQLISNTSSNDTNTTNTNNVTNTNNNTNNNNNVTNTTNSTITNNVTSPSSTSNTNTIYKKSLLNDSYKYIGCYRDYPENYYTRRLKDKVDVKPITIEECNNYANNTGYKIYGLQNFDIITGKGDCYVGNDLIRATNFDSNTNETTYIKGECLKYGDFIVGGKGSNALYTNYGPTYEYLGCFKENKDKIKMDENKRHLRFIDCQGASQTNNYKYYGIKDWGMLHIFKGNCFLTNNFNETDNLEQGTCVTAKAHTEANDLSLLNDRIVGIKDNYAIYKRLDVT